MKSHPLGGTLQIKHPLGIAPALALALTLVTSGLAEAAARQPDIQARLTPQVVTGHNQLGYKIQLLEEYVRREGGLDCVIVGSSVADTGVDPDALSEAYQRRTGKPIRCFNFGLSAADSHAAASIAAYAMRLHPRLVIYAASYVDFGNPYSRDLRQLPLIRLANGQFNPEGWLETNSASYRHLLAYRTILEAGEVDPAFPGYAGYTPAGHGLYTPVFDPVSGPIPDVMLQRLPIINIYRDDLGGLAHLGELAQGGTEVVILNTPFPARLLDLLPFRTARYDRYVSVLQEESAAYGLLYAPGDQVPVPDGGWGNINHLNTTGARAFSTWVGEWLAESLRDR